MGDKLGRAVAETGIPLVAILAEDRAEMARGLFTQGYPKARADELAASIPDYDAALQMLGRHRIRYDRPGPTDWISGQIGSNQREELFACLHGVMCGNHVSEILGAMERIISLFQTNPHGDETGEW